MNNNALPSQIPIGYATMSSALPLAANYHRWVLQLLRPHLRGQGLEIGFGYGQYTKELAASLERLVAVDCDPELWEKKPPLPANVDFVLADLLDPGYPAKVGAGAFDSVICLNVLEHIEQDGQALRNIWACLRPGGCLLLLVPAHPALFGPMDSLAGHWRRYTRPVLKERLRETGFVPQELYYLNPLGALGWWVNAKIMRPRTLSDPAVNRQILWFDRYIQPVSQFLSTFTRTFFGQSLWALARKPES